MRDFLFGLLVLGTILVIALGGTWVVTGNNFFLYKYFAPKQEQVRREVFEQTKSFRDGMIQELQNMQFQYEQADQAHKAALGALILHRATEIDESALPADLKQFINGLRRGER